MAQEATKYTLGQTIWYQGEKGTVVDTLDADEDDDYVVIVEDEDGHEDMYRAKADELEQRRSGPMNETHRHGFGKVEVAARSRKFHEHGVNFSISAQGSGSSLSAGEARDVAEALRDGGKALGILLGDDVEEVADAFEAAAESLEQHERHR